MKPYGASLCMKCGAVEPAFGSFFCEDCGKGLVGKRKTELAAPAVNNRIRLNYSQSATPKPRR